MIIEAHVDLFALKPFIGDADGLLSNAADIGCCIVFVFELERDGLASKREEKASPLLALVDVDTEGRTAGLSGREMGELAR